MEDYSNEEGSGLELVHVSDVLDYLGNFYGELFKTVLPKKLFDFFINSSNCRSIRSRAAGSSYPG